MTLTIGNWACIVAYATCIFGYTFYIWKEDIEYNSWQKEGTGWSRGHKYPIFRWVLTSIAILTTAALIVGISWWNTHTASGIRGYKDFQSNMDNGLEREITITAEDGREIFHYEGKFDVEFDNEGNYIRFECNGVRYCIDYGVQDTVKIIEKTK